MGELVTVDWIIFGVTAISTLLSINRGFVKEALSLAILIVAIMVSRLFGAEVSTLLVDHIEMQMIRYLVAYLGLFCVTLILGGLFSSLLSQIVKIAGLSIIDRLLGMMFGFARGILILTVVFAVLAGLGFPQDDWWQESAFIDRFVALGHWLQMLDMEGVSKLLERTPNAT